MLLLLFSARVRANDTNAIQAKNSLAPDVVSASGAETNGFSAAIRVSGNGKPYLEFKVYVRQTLGTNFPPERRSIGTGPPYLGPSNRFCGPVELCTAAGVKVPLLKSELASLQAYPPTLSWTVLMMEEMRRRGPSHVVPGDRGLFGSKGTDSGGQLGLYELRDYYKIIEPGKLQLTIWPKLYRKTKENNDLYERIDIPPVSLKIDWPGEPK